MELYTFLIFIAVGIIFLFVALYFIPVNLWITAIFSGVKVDLMELVFMRIRKVPPGLVVRSLISLNSAGIDVKTSDLETHYLAGGNLDNVTNGLIKAKNQDQELSFKEATVLDLSGKDIEYHLKKKLIETESGIDVLRLQLSDAILKKLDSDQIKEVARVIGHMNAD